MGAACFKALNVPSIPLNGHTGQLKLWYNKANMPSLLLVVLVVQLAIHLVNTLGATAINDFVCS